MVHDFYSTYTLSEGTDFSQQVGDNIRSVIVDNYSNSWMYLPAINRYIPPLKHGFIGTYLSASQIVLVQWRTPPGLTAQPTSNTGTATVVVTSTRLGQSNGTTITQPQQQSTQVSGGFTFSLAAGAKSTIIAAVARQRIIVQGWTFTINATTPATLGNYHLYLEGTVSAVDVADAQLAWYSDVGVGCIVIQAQSVNGVPLAFGEGLQMRNDAASPGAAETIGTIQYTQQ